MSCMEPLYGFFCLEAPEMFCELQSFTGLSIGMPEDECKMTERSFLLGRAAILPLTV